MKIIVVGSGKVGGTITQQLVREGHDVAVVDNDPAVVEDLTNSLDVMGVIGNGANYSVLKDAGIEDANLLLAVTGEDELNLLCCLLAKQAAGCKTIARVRNPEYRQEIDLIREQLGLSMIVNPEYAAAAEMGRILRTPSAIKIETFSRGRVELMKVVIPKHSSIDGVRLVDLPSVTKTEVLVCAVERGDEVSIPSGQSVLHAGDKISIVATPENARTFFANVGIETRRIKNVMIVGGSRIAVYLSHILKRAGADITIIEKNPERCQMLSEELTHVTVINGDAIDRELLLEEGIRDMDGFVSMTGIDEANIFLSLFAKSCSNAKIITKVNRIKFDEIIESFDLGSVIYPKRITAEQITAYVRAMQNSMGSNNIETLYNIIENRVEALEFNVREESFVTGIPLSDLQTKPNVLIAGISRDNRTIIPNGQSRIQVGDAVIAVTTQQGVDNLTDLFEMNV